MRVCDAATMRDLDLKAIQEMGIPGMVLMENAGRGAAEVLLETWPEQARKGVCVLCGRGNNGGDGYVIARHLHNAGVPVHVFYFAGREQILGDADLNLKVIENLGLPVTQVAQEDAWTSARGYALSCAVLVDALLGTGLKAEVTGLLRTVIEDINSAESRVLAVDLPSGLDASTGKVLGVAVRADVTATFGVAKLGQVIEPGASLVGRLEVIDISLPRSLVEQRPEHDCLVTADEVAALLPPRPRSGHKGTFGHVLVVAGSVGKVGAAVLACHAALRSGVGLVTLALPRGATGYLAGLWPEIMLEPIEDNGAGHLVPPAIAHLLSLVEARDAVALGPGLSTAPGVADVLSELLRKIDKPAVIDADGLNAFVGRTGEFAEARSQLVLTPHPGEAARLLATGVSAVQENRVGSIRTLAQRCGATIVLKGERTLVATTRGRLSINPTGNPGMGTGGTGDVLTGLIGGLLAQGMGTEEAAIAGTYLHGVAGDLASSVMGERAMVAGDLIAQLGASFQQVVGSEA